jgi:hypothetical protein
VGGEGEKIHLEHVDVDGDFACGLHGVGVKVNVGLFGDAADFFEGLDGAEFIVGVHDADERGGRRRSSAGESLRITQTGLHCAAYSAGINAAVAIDGKISDRNAVLFQSLASVQNRLVLDGGSDDVLMLREDVAAREFVVLIEVGKRTTHERIDDAKDGVIVRFGAAAGEDDFLGAGADQGGDLFTGGFDGGAGALAGGVDGSSVGEFAREMGKHGVEHFGLDGRGGVEIEVDAVHKATDRIPPGGELKGDRGLGNSVGEDTGRVPEWELLVHTRQFSQEWQTKGLRNTELGRVYGRWEVGRKHAETLAR